MVSVVLLGNCNFTMQAAIGVSYIVLNGAYWGTALINKYRFWDHRLYLPEDVTPEWAINAYKSKDTHNKEDVACFTRTMWYAIRETKKAGWVRRGGAAPLTERWNKWLEEAEAAAKGPEVDKWKAIHRRDEIVGHPADIESPNEAVQRNAVEQHVPAVDIPLQASRQRSVRAPTAIRVCMFES